MKTHGRVVLLVLLALMMGMLLACAAPTPQLQVVEETVVVEKPVAATPVEKIVEKTVVQTVVVERTIVPTPAPGVTGGTFVFARSADPSSLDPMLGAEGEGLRTHEQMFEGLVRSRAGTTEIEPALAERWEVSKDAQTWTFYLRKGVKFHDGTPFNADAVVFNFDRWRLKDHPYRVGDFANWVTFMGGFPGSLIDIVAVDEYTVRMSLDKPIGPFLAYLTSPNFYLSSPTAIKADPENVFRNPVGTGAFKFVEWIPGDRIVMERFEDYWGPPPYVDKVIMRVIKDSTAAFLELKAGTVDAIDDSNPDDIALAQNDPSLKVLLRDYYATAQLVPNHSIKPLDDPKVRWAIAHGIDREALQVLYGGMATPGNQFRPPNDWAYNPDLATIEYDPEKSKQLLAEAGYPNGIEIDFWYMSVSRAYYPRPLEIAQAMASDLAKAGIKVNLKTEDWAAYLNDRPNFAIWMMGGWPPVPDPAWTLTLMFGERIPREGNYDNAKLRDLIQQAQSTADQAARVQLYREAATIVYDDMVLIPVMFARTGAVIASSRVNGYYPSALGRERYQHVWLTK